MSKLLIISLFVMFFSVEAIQSQSTVEFPETSVSVSNVSKNEEKPKSKIEEVFINTNFYYGIIMDIVFVTLIILLIYYPNYKKSDTIFTFVLFNIIIYLLTYFLNGVKMSTGAAFGLFAVFTLLRYRTTSINMRDMTYLFIFIAMGLLSAIQLRVVDILIIYSLIFVSIFLMDSKLIMKREFYKEVSIREIDLAHTDKMPELLELMKERTGLNIQRISIKKLNYKSESVDLKVYYHE